MSVKKTSKGYLVDCRGSDGRRHRRTFEVRQDARDFEFKIKYGELVSSKEDRKPASYAIQKFIDLEIPKDSVRDRKYLAEFYDYLIDELNLEHIDEIEPIHIDEYQALLRDQSKRIQLWKKVEESRRRNCILNKEGYIPAIMNGRNVVSLTGNSIRRRFVVIKAFFKKAKLWKWIDSNPCSEITIKSSAIKMRKTWTDDQINEAINRARPWAKRPFWLIAVTGIRPIGTCRLQLNDLDFENRQFWVSSYKGKGGVLRRYKVVMTNALYEFFSEIASEVQIRPMIGPFKEKLFLSFNNKELFPEALGEEMRRVADSMGLPDHSLYGFRHSMGTAAANPSKDGEYVGNLDIARQVLGHSNISQTAGYNHGDDQILRSQLEKLDEIRGIKIPKLR